MRVKQKIFSGCYFHLKTIPKGVLRHLEILRDINKWKMRRQNLVIFEQKPWTKPLENVDFGTNYKYSFKSFDLNHGVLKRLLRHFLGSQGIFTTRRHPKGHKQVKNADFKIWSFLTKNRGLTFWRKVEFRTNTNILLVSFPREFYDTPISLGT